MTRVILLAHAPLASAFRAVAGHLPSANAVTVEAFDVGANANPEGVARDLRRALDSSPAPALILCDIPGATPFNGACLLARSRPGVRVVAGLNVPMLWRVVCAGDQPLDRLARLAIERSVMGVDAEASNMDPAG